MTFKNMFIMSIIIVKQSSCVLLPSVGEVAVEQLETQAASALWAANPRAQALLVYRLSA